MPLDNQLWWHYFNGVLQERPFIRLGATCILENIADGSNDVLDHLIKASSFLNPKNLRFLMIHRHGPNLAHGDQILEALEHADLSEAENEDVLKGAEIATTLYMRFTHWILTGEDLR